MKKCARVAGLLLGVLASVPVLAASPDVVLYSSDVPTISGNWSKTATTGAAGGQALRSADNGWSSADSPLTNPADFFEATFSAAANTPYHVWIRMRATSDSKWNDSAWLQFSDAVDAASAPLYRSGTSSALLMNLEGCSGCGVSGWGWVDGSWWLAQARTVRFQTAGLHTIRIQTREDGAQIDQIVLSPSTFFSAAPGPNKNDTTIVAKPSGGVGATPYSGTPVSLPGTLATSNYDKGGEGIAYHDTTAGNSGGVFRTDDVDVEASGDGGYDVGWLAAGEWLNYSVSVATAGTYTAQLRVAAPSSGGAFHLAFSAPSSASSSATVPLTGGWQNWTTVSVPITLAAGAQTLTLGADTNGFNVGALTLTRTSGSSGGGGSPTPVSGTAAAIPGTVEAENFDDGGEGVAYHDTTAENSGAQFRSTGVDIEAASGGGYDVGWMAVGEWLGYTVNVTASGSYTAAFRVAASGSGGTFHLEVAGRDVTGPLTISDTGGWQAWTTVSSTVSLTAGTQFARLIIDSTGSVVGNVDRMTFTAASSTPPSGAGGATISVPAGGDLQDAINRAQPGDTILLAPGALYSRGYSLPAKPGIGVITIRSGASDAVLPSAGVRIGPADAGNLPKVEGTFGLPAFYTEPGSHDYRLMFLEMVSAFNGSDLLDLGDGSSAQNSLASVPWNLVVDRCYLHGNPTEGQKRGIALNSGNATVANSYISDIKLANSDTQAVGGWNGPGPYTITNNYLEAAGENVMFGGGDPAIAQLVPSDITISRNYISKPVAWRTQNWTIKNLIELKNAQRVTFDGNLVENNWLSGQAGYAIVLTPRNQDHTAPWSTVQHITFTNNIVQHVAGGFDILGTDDLAVTEPLSDVSVVNNLFLDVSRTNWGGTGVFLVTLGGSNLRFDHNTIFGDGSSEVYGDVAPVTDFAFTNNIVPPSTWTVMGSGQAPGNGTIDAFYPNSTFARDVFIGAPGAQYPSNNYFPATMSDVGFVSASGGNYRLAASSAYKAKATDGTDIGANIDALNAAAGTSY